MASIHVFRCSNNDCFFYISDEVRLKKLYYTPYSEADNNYIGSATLLHKLLFQVGPDHLLVGPGPTRPTPGYATDD